MNKAQAAEYRAKNRAKITAYNTKWMRERRKQRIADGLCISCGARKGKYGKTHCQICLDRTANWQSSHRASQKPKARALRKADND